MSYERVLPRDLFNEAKLLKCLGVLTLKMLDGAVPGLEYEQGFGGFEVDLTDAGDLYVSNLTFYKSKGEVFFMSTTYNSRMNFPLECTTPDNESCYVFDEDGNLSADFKKIIGLE